MPRWETIWIGGAVATMEPGGEPFGLIADGALAVAEGKIEWVGPRDRLPDRPDRCAARVVDTEGGLLTPGLVDCHTHLVFGGHRADEFQARLRGASYEEIARAGGGIRSTVRTTRGASEEALLASGEARLRELLREGVTTVEIKSGYGLDLETELRMLRVARRLGQRLPVSVQATLLGLHALPPEYEGRRHEYVALVRDEMVPRVADEGLAEAVDAFCESIAFSPAECRSVLEAARSRGLGVRLHADQLSDLGGAALAAEMGARSADHLEHASEEGVRAMGGAGTVAVLLPGAFYFLGEARKPPVGPFRTHGVPMALATDLNPGTSPLPSILLAVNMGCVLFGLTAEEALAGVTRNGARALGLHEDRGTLSVGKRADLAVWDVGDPAELAYWIGRNPCRSVVRAGEAVTLPATAPAAPASS